MAFGQPLEPGTKAYFFNYVPKHHFIIQEVEILGRDGLDYTVKTKGPLFTAPRKFLLNPLEPNVKTSMTVDRVRSTTFVKNVFKKYGKSILEDIFEGIKQ